MSAVQIGLTVPGGRSLVAEDPERQERSATGRDPSQRYTLGTHPTGGQGSATGTSGHDGLREVAG
jgi:hypothetical protein